MRSFKGSLHEWVEADCPIISDHQAEQYLIEAVLDDQRSLALLVLERSSWIGSDNMEQGPGNPIRLALELGHERCLKAFLDHSDCAQWRFKHGQTLLHQAIESDALWAIEPLLRSGAPLDAANIAGLTPAALAGRAGKTEALSRLLESAKATGASFENTHQPQWQIEANPSALCVALVSLASAIQQRFSESDIAFIRQSCQMLADAGSSPNEPCGALALMSQRLSGNFTASAESARGALAFALGLGARWEPSGMEGQSALEAAASRFDSSLVQTLIELGAPLPAERSALAEPAWRQALAHERWRDSRHVGILARWCAMEGFWPPMAASKPEIEAFFARFERLAGPQRKAESERLELYAQTRRANAPDRAKTACARL